MFSIYFLSQSRERNVIFECRHRKTADEQDATSNRHGYKWRKLLTKKQIKLTRVNFETTWQIR